ncbi:MAG: DNA polymerase I [Lachnospiraceae bacterium]|nr:DNA polymerase I [Lachnospiraceae bacterium]
MAKKLLLIDGFSILFRAFYGMPLSMTSPDGAHTGAVYGFMTILNKVLEEEAPDYLAVAFDRPEPTFRHEMYADYKGNRDAAPPEFHEQVPILKDLLEKMNIPIVSEPGYEADDVLGTLANRAAGEGMDVTVVSGDRDLLQIASDRIRIVVPKTRGGKTEYENYTPSDVESVYGVTPKKFIELKALMGDSSDNVPGLPGVGPKTALKILQNFGSIENAHEHLPEIKPNKAMESMRDHYDLLELSRKLVTILTDAPFELDPDSLTVENIYNQAGYEELRRLGFRSMLEKYARKMEASGAEASPETNPQNTPDPAEEPSCSTGERENITVRTAEDAAKAFAALVSEEAVGVSVLRENGVVYRSAAAAKKCTYIFEKGTEEAAAAGFAKLLKNGPEIGCCGAKAFFKWILETDEEAVLAARTRKGVFDAVVAAYLLNPLKSDWDYDAVAAGFLGEPVMAEQELVGKKGIAAFLEGNTPSLKTEQSGQVSFDFGAAESREDEEGEEKGSAAQEAVTKLAVLKAETALHAAPLLREKLEEEKMTDLFDGIEMPLVYVLASMEREGILASREELARYGASLEKRINELTAAVYEAAGEEFNLNSPKQLGQILFEKMGIPGGKKTRTGYSTAADVLEKLAPEYPIVANLLEYRTYAKLKSTYADGLAAYIEEDGRIRTTFNQTITATGRLSSTDPNLQNIPMRMELGRLIRKCFYPADGCVFVDADYSQIELRILAHMSGDEKLIEAYREARDIHRTTAAQVFHVPFDEVTDLMRRNAKAVNFGIVYGISSFGLSQGLSISRGEAADYIEQYFETYPSIKAFLDGLVAEAKEKGYAVSLYGRRRPVPELKEANFMRRSFGERVAMNSPIQGTAADIMKIAMNRVFDRLKKENLRSKLILQIHDELLIEAPEEEAEEVRKILTEEMKASADLKVALETDCHIGTDWYEAK